MITFVDHVGRTVIGEVISDTKDKLVVRNPVILFVEPHPQTGQIQVQSFPYLFFEFLEDGKREQNEWTFVKTSIAVSNCCLNARIIEQYKNINNPKAVILNPGSMTPQAAVPGAPGTAEPEVIKLFDD